ncbi:MAG: hypothetical protein HKM05_04515 [Spirochaetales bacterium]|nr:hypothetical protein [Spirochaetales bacterium]
MPALDSLAQRKRGAGEVSLVLGLAFLLSFYVQFILLDRVKGVVLEHLTNFAAKGLQKAGLVGVVLHSFQPSDWAVLGGLAALLIFLIVRQWQKHTFSHFLAFVLEDERRVAVFLIFLVFLFFKPLLAPGEPYFQDAPSHTSRAWFTYLNFKQGYFWPLWTNYYHNGFAMFSHYGFLLYVLIAALNLLVGNIFLSTKLVMFAFCLGNAFLFYAWGKRLFADRKTGLLMAVLITGGNILLYEILWVGGLFMPLVLFGFGWVVLAFEKLLAGDWKPYQAVFAASLGANVMLATHLGYSSQLLFFFFFYVLGRLLFHRPDAWGLTLRFALGCVVAGGALSAFVFLPTFLDMKDVNFYKQFPFDDPNTYQFWKVPFFKFLVPRFYMSDNNYDYLGWGLVGAAVVYFVQGLRKPDSWWWFGLLLIAASVLVANYDRNAILLYLALSIFVTASFARRWTARDGGLGRLTLLVMIFLADGMIFGNYNTYNQNNGFEQAFYSRLTSTADGSRYGVAMANSLHGGNKENTNVFVSPWLKIVGFPVMQPNAIMLEANKQALYQYAVTNDLLVADLQKGLISEQTLQGLDLLGVRFVTFHTSYAYYVPPLAPNPQVQTDPRGPWLTLTGTKPILWAPRIVSFQDAEAVQPALAQRQAFEKDNVSHNRAPFHQRPLAASYVSALIQLMNPDLTNGTATEFVLRKGATQDSGSTGPATLTVQKYTVDSERVELDFTVDKAGFAAVPFGYFGYEKVLLDGHPVTFEPTAFNTICFPVSPGVHKLTIGPSMSPARFWGALISLSALGLLIVGFVVAEILRRRKTS